MQGSAQKRLDSAFVKTKPHVWQTTSVFKKPSRNLIKKPWAFIRVPYMNPTILEVYAQGFLIRFLH